MKPGRPKRHTKPSFISVDKGAQTVFYELDSKGSLVKFHGKFKVHHVTESTVPPTRPSTPIDLDQSPVLENPLDATPIVVDFASLEPCPPPNLEIAELAVLSLDDF